HHSLGSVATLLVREVMMKNCKLCGEFPVVNSGRCRSCYNQYMAEYMKARYYRRRDEWIDRLGGECSICYTSEELEFDHVDASSKTFDIAKILSGGSAAKVEVEMAKCQLLCKPHHLEKSLREGDIASVGHGE